MSSDNIEIRLNQIEKTLEQNNKMLRAIKRKQTFDFWLSMVKLAILLGAFYYAYTFAEPYLNQAKDLFISVQGLSGFQEGSFFEFFNAYSGSEN